MANFTIITNNPTAAEKYPNITRRVDGTVADIFTAVRNAVHAGAKLISHPLAGSIKPNETPYKSVVLSTRTGPYDEKSLAVIEDAIGVLRKMPLKHRVYPQSVLEDFAAIDLDLLDSAMGALPAEYHL